MLGLTGGSALRIGLTVGVIAALVSLWALWQAADARADQAEAATDMQRAQLQQQIRKTTEAREARDEFEAALTEHRARIRSIDRKRRSTERALRKAREQASEQYRECMDVALPDGIRRGLWHDHPDE